jgi:Fusaric acid resistance protein family
VVLLPQFVNAPLALSAALAFWLGLCVYLTSLDRTPRLYAFALAGATAGIIAFPSVGSPGNVFNVAILRVQEILIGILCTTFVHGAILPRTLTARMRERVAQIVFEVEEWSTRSLAGQRDAELDKTRRKLALEINELETFAIQLPFDTARLLPDIPTLNALQDQLRVLLAATNAADHVLLRQDVQALHDALISGCSNGRILVRRGPHDGAPTTGTVLGTARRLQPRAVLVFAAPSWGCLRRVETCLRAVHARIRPAGAAHGA